MKKLILTFIAALSFGAQAGFAQMLTSADPTALMSVAQQMGNAELTTDDWGDPIIFGSMDGQEYTVWFYNCDGGENCTFVILTTSWLAPSLTAEDVNSWNAGALFGRTYLPGDGTLISELTVNFTGGVSMENFVDDMERFRSVISDVETSLL